MSIATIAVTLKAAAEVARTAGKIPLQSEILDLQQDLLGLVARQAELLEEGVSLRERIDQLDKLLKLREGFHHERNAYWKRDGDHVDGPFCSTCFDADLKAIRLIERQVGYGTCGVCKNVVPLSRPAGESGSPQRRVSGPGFVDEWKR